MDSTSMRLRARLSAGASRFDWGAAPTWLLCVGLIVYLGLKGGGFDPLVHDQVGIALWWIAFVGVLAGALPRSRPSPLALAALALLAAFVVWTALSLAWTESVDRSSEELALVATYLGVFVLAILTRSGEEAQRFVSAVAAGIVIVSIVALLSRLHPDWFPAADQTGLFLSSTRERLSYPLNYWNGLAALIAIGLPLLLQIATSAKSSLARAASAAALPALALTSFLTLSRGGIAATAVVIAVFLLLVNDRLSRLPTLIVSGVGAAILILAADRHESLQQGLLNDAAREQGSELLALTLLVCLAAGLVQLAISHPRLTGRGQQRWTHIPRAHARVATIVAVVAALVALAAVDAPGRASSAWDEFKRGDGPGKGAARLNSAAGQSRYQFWSAAVRENSTAPLIGTGAGTFEFWWARDGDAPDIVQDAHSLYFQTLGELGIVGIVLLAGFLIVILAGGVRAALLASHRARPSLVAALAGCLAFCLTAAVDWMWQLPVLPVAMLLLAAPLVAAEEGPARRSKTAFGGPLRVVFALTALVAIAAIAIPLASATLLRQSEADARAGDLSAALESARSAQNVQPGAASPRLQQALVLEAGGDLARAAGAGRDATEREPTNWRTWLVLSRIEAKRGGVSAAVRYYRRARSLNPRSSLFDR